MTRFRTGLANWGGELASNDLRIRAHSRGLPEALFVARHITRKELKKDQIREGFVHGAEAVASHQQQTLALRWRGAGLCRRAGLALLYSEADRPRLRRAGRRHEFTRRASAPTNEPAAPGEVTYVDQKNKYADAAKKFVEVADRYPRTRPGQVARYYAALSLERTRPLR